MTQGARNSNVCRGYGALCTHPLHGGLTIRSTQSERGEIGALERDGSQRPTRSSLEKADARPTEIALTVIHEYRTR